jgi:hypothetical protein
MHPFSEDFSVTWAGFVLAFSEFSFGGNVSEV